MWSFLNEGRNLNGAHDSLIDAKAQTDIIVDEHFHNFIDRSKSIRCIDELFSKKDQNKISKATESVREVHLPCRELKPGDDFSWDPRPQDQYTSTLGGGVCGPI